MTLRDKLLHQISDLLDGRCADCPKLKELNRIHGKSTSHIDGYCQRTCEVGRQLKVFGEKLNGTLRCRADNQEEAV